MATIRKELDLPRPAEEVWDAVRDFGAVHKRLGPGFLLDAHWDGDARVVTFFNNMVVREPLVTLDDESRRLVYSATGGMSRHYNAAMEVVPEGADRCRLVWTIDLLPNELAPTVEGMADKACEAMKRTLEGRVTD
jgi:carbon monoxide dehydrogenase subunit G